MEKKSRIPESLEENIARMKSILAKQERDLENLRRQHQEARDAENKKLDEADEEKAKEEPDMEKVANLELMARKHAFDRRYFGGKIKTLKGKIAWAKERHIPFLEEELRGQPLTQKPFAAVLGETKTE